MPVLNAMPVFLSTKVIFPSGMMGKLFISCNIVTAAYPAGADSPSAFPTTGVVRIPPIDGFTANLAFITVKGKTAIATDQHMIIPAFGNDMDGTADQADRCHFRLVSDAVAILAIMIEKFAGRILVEGFHGISSR
jgi:hypothetical protein